MLKFISAIIEKCLEVFNQENSSKYDNLVKEFQELAHKISEKYLYSYNNQYRLDENFWYRYSLYNYLKKSNILEIKNENEFFSSDQIKRFRGRYVSSSKIIRDIENEYEKYQKNNIQDIYFPDALISCANEKILFNRDTNKFYFDVLRNRDRRNYLSYFFNDDQQAYAFMMYIEIERLDNLCDNRSNIISK